ncbi:MAG: ral nucleoside transport system permease protein, partial [Thermoleophilales bacterium]|nr:ral nucleoside transport system permease protein [Thermoleophilales bacterium]
MSFVLTTAFFAAIIRLTMPLVIAAVGEVIAERSGVFNVAIEGLMLIGAFGAVWGAHILGFSAGGILFAMALSLAAGMVVGVLVITLRLDQIVVGIVATILALGVTSYLNDQIFNGRASGAHQLKTVALPLLSDIPGIGPVLFRQNAVVYVGYVLIFATAIWLKRSRGGLLVRATGERPAAVDFSGHNVIRVRYMALGFGALTAGLAGALISLGTGGIFVDDMTAGRGWIALIAVMLGRWNPVGAAAGCVLFGVGDALQFRFQALGYDLPYELFYAVPYLLTLAVLLFASGKTRQPAALTIPYET